MANYETITLTVESSVATVTLNRPEVYNAFNEAMTTELAVAFKQIAKDDAVRAVVLTGAGKAFSSGQDLKDLEPQYADGATPVLGDRLRKGYNPVIRRIRELEKPVVAAVNGVAAGAGCSFALAADLRVMADRASLIEVFVNVGLVPDSGSTFFLPRLVGMGRAMEMCMLGDKVGAEEALRLGLANRVVPVEEVVPVATEMAGRLASLPTRGIGLTKRLLNQSFDRDLVAQLDDEAHCQETAGQTHDHLEGVRAFLAKRQPEFKGN